MFALYLFCLLIVSENNHCFLFLVSEPWQIRTIRIITTTNNSQPMDGKTLGKVTEFPSTWTRISAKNSNSQPSLINITKFVCFNKQFSLTDHFKPFITLNHHQLEVQTHRQQECTVRCLPAMTLRT